MKKDWLQTTKKPSPFGLGSSLFKNILMQHEVQHEATYAKA